MDIFYFSSVFGVLSIFSKIDILLSDKGLSTPPLDSVMLNAFKLLEKIIADLIQICFPLPRTTRT